MITKKAEYAIIALTELAGSGADAKVTTKDIAQRRDIPVNLVMQLISVLREAGWVVCTRGPAGGVVLSRNPEEITLREVIELVDGPIGITRCLLQEGPCNDQASCPLRGVWSQAQQKMLEVLEQVTIKELAETSQTITGLV